MTVKAADPATGTLWLTVADFSRKQQKHINTIYLWIDTGFIIELGFVIRRDVTGHIDIGIPRHHPSFREFL